MRLLLLLALGTLLSGCASTEPLPPGAIPPPAKPLAGWNKPLPAWSALASTYNARLEGLDRLRAPITIVVDAPDGTGGRRHDQLEGNLQILLPDKVALRLDKVGQTVFQLGCDSTRYWSLDFTGTPTGLIGTHAKMDPRVAARFGVPVHPLDLVDLLAITPLPTQPGGATLEWGATKDTILVTLPPRSRAGAKRRLTLDARTLFPRRVELLGEGARPVAAADLSRFVAVELPGAAISMTKIAERYEVSLPSEEATVSLNIYDPKNPGPAIRMQAFDLKALLEAYAVSRVVDLDLEAKR